MSRVSPQAFASVLRDAFAASGLPHLVDADAKGFEALIKDQRFLKLHEGLEVSSYDPKTNPFRSRDVEPLIDQSMGLMLQAVSDRIAWQTAGEKWANLMLQLFHERNYLQAAQDSQKALEQNIKAREEILAAELLRQRSRAERLDLLKGIAARQDPRQRPASDQSKRTASIEYARIAMNPQGYVYPDKWGSPRVVDPAWAPDQADEVVYDPNIKKRLPDLIPALAARFQLSAAETTYRETLIQQQALEAEVDAGAHGIQAIGNELASLRSNLSAERARLDTDEEVLAYKLGMTAYAELLGFRQQVTSHQRRYQVAAVAAYQRLQAAEQGLKTVFGRDVPLPMLNPESISSFDEVYVWLVNTVAFLAAFERGSQEFSIRVSLKDQGQWPKEWRIDTVIPFKVDVKRLTTDGTVRLRGLSAEMFGGEQLSGRVTLEIRNERAAERCLVSTVRTAEEGIVPEVFGQRVFFNLDPNGDWQVGIKDLIGGGSSAKPPADLCIDLHLSTHARPEEFR